MEAADMKSRGRKHCTNKAKYQRKDKHKNKEKQDSENTDEDYALKSNWDRYEEPEQDAECTNSSTKFHIVSQTPLSQGGHFVFKSYKNIEFESDLGVFKNNKLFALDFHSLGNSLKCIPFNELSDLDTTYLTDESLQRYKDEATASKVLYESYLRDKTLNTSGLESALKSIISDQSENVIERTVSAKVELEQWLDDILDS